MKNIILILLFVIPSHAQEFIKIAGDLNFPEGPAWDGKGTLFLSSCYGGYIYRISGNEQEVFIDSLTSIIRQTNGLTFDKDGNLFACDYGKGAIIRILADKSADIVSNGYDGKRFNRPNDLAFHPDGRLYFTDPKSYGADKPDGRLFRLNVSTGEVELLRDSLCFPNGIAFSGNAKELYVCESAKNRILKFVLDENGNINSEEIFSELPGGDPDGIDFDIMGNLYVAHFGGGTIYVLNENGFVVEKISTPGKKPSNVEFGGEDLKTLYITEDETNSVYYIRRGIPGLKK